MNNLKKDKGGVINTRLAGGRGPQIREGADKKSVLKKLVIRLIRIVVILIVLALIAIFAISKTVGIPSVSEFLIKDTPTIVKVATIKMLGYCDSEESLVILVKSLREDDPKVRRAAARALGKSGNFIVLESLLDALRHAFRDKLINKDDQAAFRAILQSVIKILSENISVPSSMRYGGDYSLFAEFNDDLDDAFDDLRHDLRMRDSRTIQNNVLFEIYNEEITDALNDKDPNVRYVALMMLMYTSPREVRFDESFVDLLDDENEFIRFQAALMLVRGNNDHAVETILEFMDSGDPTVRLLSIRSLMSVPANPKVDDALIKALDDENYRVRMYAIEALGKRESPTVVDALIKALDDKNSEVRLIAMKSLGMMHDTRVIDPLLSILEDNDPTIRGNAAIILGNKNDSRIVDALIPLLKDNNLNVRKHAIKALGEQGSLDAVEALVPCLEDPNVGVRVAAINALWRLGDERSVAAAEKLYDSGMINERYGSGYNLDYRLESQLRQKREKEK